MNILLINPATDFKKFGRFGKLMERIPPLGLAYIAAVLQKNNFKVEIIDDFVLNIGISGILKRIKEKKIKIVGISCLTPSANITYSIAREIKSIYRDIVIISGNIHASFFAEEILRNRDIDIIIHGEAEYIFLEIVKSLLENKPLNSIKGISFKENGRIIHNKWISIIENLDTLPTPSWALFPLSKYSLFPYTPGRGRCISMLTSRGCPYNCIFCSLPYFGRKYRARDPVKVVEEIKNVKENYRIEEIAFVDPVFSLIKNHTVKFCEEILKNNLNKKIKWICETRTDLVDKEILKLMKEAGCRRILFGIESATQEILNNIKKEVELKKTIEIIKFCKEIKLEVGGFFMLGLPGETKNSCEETIDFARKLNLDFAKFAITVPFPGSKLFEELKKEGKLEREDWENFTTFNPDAESLIYAPEGITKKELVMIQKKAHLLFYMQPRIILKTLRKITEIPFTRLIQTLVTIAALFFDFKRRWK